MPETAPACTAPDVGELAFVRRSGFVESRHLGSLIAIDESGADVLTIGDVDAAVLPRSTIKPVQALACLTAGAPLEGAELAIAAGSHTGEDAHVHLVKQILARAGLDESALGCPADRPEDDTTFEHMILTGEPRNPLRMNCSGKHAAMLLTCAVNDWSTHDYLEVDHPLQQHIRQTVATVTETDVTHVAIDGCGAPNFGTTVRGLATAFRALVTGDGAAGAVSRAMREHPFFVGGTGHANSELMRRVPGALAKGGAEGVIGVVSASGAAVAMKIMDGSPRATTVIAVRVLRSLGVDVSQAGDLASVSVLGGGVPVGEIGPSDALDAALAGAAATR